MLLCLTSSPRLSPAADRLGPKISGDSGDGGGNVRLSSGVVVPSAPSSLRWSGPRKAKSKFSVPVTTQDNVTMETAEDGTDHLPICNLDPKIAEFKDHYDYRMKRYLDQKQLIEEHEGKALKISLKAIWKFGINTEGLCDHQDGFHSNWASTLDSLLD